MEKCQEYIYTVFNYRCISKLFYRILSEPISLSIFLWQLLVEFSATFLKLLMYLMTTFSYINIFQRLGISDIVMHGSNTGYNMFKILHVKLFANSSQQTIQYMRRFPIKNMHKKCFSSHST